MAQLCIVVLFYFSCLPASSRADSVEPVASCNGQDGTCAGPATDSMLQKLADLESVDIADFEKEAGNLAAEAKTASWRRRRTTPAPTPATPTPAPTPMSAEGRLAIDMAKMASAVYDLSEVEGWDLELVWTEADPTWPNSHDEFALYKQGPLCALAIAGTNDVPDVWDDLNVLTTQPICGMEVVSGFANEVTDFTTSEAYITEFQPMLQDCGQVYVTGHSLGGAVATVLAACASNGDVTWNLAGLYTIGAPGVSVNTQVAAADGGCLPGLRVFNFDANTYDPVPYIASIRPGGALLHPKVAAASFTSTWSDGLARADYDCASNVASVVPNEKGWRALSIEDHKAGRYIERLISHFSMDS